MPTFSLRRVGMSYLIEGLTDSVLDSLDLCDALEAAYGPAIAPMDAGPDGRGFALIIDRRAETWEHLRNRLAEFARAQGYTYVAWAEDGLGVDGRAVLHFHPRAPGST